MSYLTEATEKFIHKIEEFHKDPRYIGVWQMYVIHGGKYDGPQYAEELKELKLALARQIEDDQH